MYIKKIEEKVPGKVGECICTVPRKCVNFCHADRNYENIQLQAFIKRNT